MKEYFKSPWTKVVDAEIFNDWFKISLTLQRPNIVGLLEKFAQMLR